MTVAGIAASLSAAEARLEAARQLFLEGDEVALAGALNLPAGSRLGSGPAPRVAPHAFQVVEGTIAHARDCKLCPHPPEHEAHEVDAWLSAAHAAYHSGDRRALGYALGLDLSRPVERPLFTLPNEGEPCSSCGATVEECNKVIAQTVADRSCCLRCKSTDTHQLTPAGRRG